MQLIGLIGYFGSGREDIATACVQKGWRRVGLLDAVRKDLACALKKFPALTAEDTRGLLMEWRRLRDSKQPGFWRAGVKPLLTAGGRIVIPDVYDLDDARMVLQHGGQLFHVFRPGTLPADAAEGKAVQAIANAWDVPEIVYGASAREAAVDVLARILEAVA